MKKRRTPPPKCIQKGEVRNPLGINNRAKATQTRSITHFLLRLRDEESRRLLDEPHKMTNAEKLARKIYFHAEEGKAPYAEMVLDRTEGKVSSPVELSGAGGAGGAGVTFILDLSGKPDDDSGS
jgi:hypothetical protein